MKALRRILTAVLVCVMVLGCVPFGAVAEEDYGSVLNSTLTDYYERSDAHMEHGYFPEGELPCMAFIFKQIKLVSNGMFFGDYCIVTTTEEGYKRYTYEIPADVFEAAVFEIFSETDATLSVVRGGKEYMTDRGEPYYRIEGADLQLEVSNEYEIEYVGYSEREDGGVDAWLYVIGGVPENPIAYVSRYSKVTDYTGMGIGFRYGTMRARYVVHSIADIELGAVTIRSFEKADAEDMPRDLKEYNVPDKIQMDGCYMHTTVEPFGVGTEVYCDNSNADHGLIYGYAKDALDGVETAVSAYKFTAVSGREQIQPKSPVTVEFILPGTFSTDVRVYRINEVIPEETGDHSIWEKHWKYELVESTVNVTSRTAVAVIDDFDCIYAVGGDSKAGSGDVNYDGKLNLRDAAFILRYIAKWSYPKVDIEVADVTCDGRVNLADVSKILKIVAKWNWMPMPKL